MITNKDIRVENGFLIINGDKYPLEGQSPAAIMKIVEDNSDTTPTENSDAPITSGGVYTALTDVDAYTVSDISDINASLTINEFSLRKCGKLAILGLNFNASDTIALSTKLFKLPTGIVSLGRIDSLGIFTNKTLHSVLSISTDGYVTSSKAIDTGTYYMGSIIFFVG